MKSKKCCLIYPESEEGIDKRPLTLVRDPDTDNPEETTIIMARTIDLHLEENINFENYINEIKDQLRGIISELTSK